MFIRNLIYLVISGLWPRIHTHDTINKVYWRQITRSDTNRLQKIHMYLYFSGGLMPSASEVKGQIDFNNVTFSYPTRKDSQILSGMNLSMPAGSMTAVVGSSGSGKSTIASLLMRFYDPNQGMQKLCQNVK